MPTINERRIMVRVPGIRSARTLSVHQNISRRCIEIEVDQNGSMVTAELSHHETNRLLDAMNVGIHDAIYAVPELVLAGNDGDASARGRVTVKPHRHKHSDEGSDWSFEISIISNGSVRAVRLEEWSLRRVRDRIHAFKHEVILSEDA